MAITRKPKAGPSPDVGQSVDIDALINKGGSAAGSVGQGASSSDKVIPITLRIPADILEAVNRVLKARRVKMSRHTWILEAMVEKIEKEG